MLSGAPMSLAATRSKPARVHYDLERGPTDSSQSVDGDSGRGALHC
jgi:hypothetical protein